MSTRSPRDVIDYIDDTSYHEDETPFFPVHPDQGPDWLSAFWGGILIGLAGAGLVTLLPWLAGTLIFGGYGLTALSLRGSRNGFARALGFGYGLMAGVGAAMLFGEIFFPKATAWIIAAAAQHHVILLSLAALAWPIALVKYLFARFRRAGAAR